VEYIETNHGLFARPTVQPHWDLLVAHPPCTYLASSGMHWTVRGLRDPQLTEDALGFVRLLLAAPVPHIALENPVGAISTRIRPPDQTIQPWQFGDAESKATCLWLVNLPPLMATHADGDLFAAPLPARADHGRWNNQTAGGQNKLPPSKDRWKVRSRTYPGIAQAMAKQWSEYLLTYATACA
jgi:hypothetical protein